jgi:hypothetical protein
MKRLLSLIALFSAADFARADLVVEQKMESAMQNGTVTFMIKGDVARIDSPSPGSGMLTTIIDTKAGTMTSLSATQKVAMERDLAAARKSAEAAMASAGFERPKTPPVATGQKQKIGNWDAEEYTIPVNGMTIHIWVAPNFPNGKFVKEELSKFSKAASGGALDPNTFDLPGVVVKSQMDTSAGPVTTTMISAEEKPVPADDLKVPEGYRSMPVPPQLSFPKQ